MRWALGVAGWAACVDAGDKAPVDADSEPVGVEDSDRVVADTDTEPPPEETDAPPLPACEDPATPPPDVPAAVVVTACALRPGGVVAVDADNFIPGIGPFGAVGPRRVRAVRGALRPGVTALVAWSAVDEADAEQHRAVWPVSSLAVRGLGAPALHHTVPGALSTPHAVAVLRGVNGAPCRLFEEAFSEGAVPQPDTAQLLLGLGTDLPLGTADSEPWWFEGIGQGGRAEVGAAWSEVDVTGDGYADLVLADALGLDHGEPVVDVFAGPAPDPRAASVAQLGHREQGPLSLAVGDLDGDGVGDLAWVAQDLQLGATGRIRVWRGPLVGRHENDETDLAAAPRALGDDLRTVTLTAGDLDGDGVDDLVASARGVGAAPEVMIFYGPVDRRPLDRAHADALLRVPSAADGVTAVVVPDMLGGPGPDLALAAGEAAPEAFEDRILPEGTVGVGWLLDGDLHGEVDVGAVATWIGPSLDDYGSVLGGGVFPLGDLNGDGAGDLGLQAARLDDGLPFRVGIVLGCPGGTR